MIEKLKQTVKGFDDTPQMPTATEFLDKINELVDAVNELQLSIKPILEERESGIKVYEETQDMYDNAILDALKDKQVDVVVKPADPYAEQRRWIGKLCRFWDSVYDRYYFDTLQGITDEGLFIGHNGIWKHCEPVKADSDIIYKGSDNEK